MSTSSKNRIGLLTDIHYDGSIGMKDRLYDTVELLNKSGAAVLIVMGDLVNASTDLSANRLLREIGVLCRGFDGPVYFMPGNHDLDHISKQQFGSAVGQEGATHLHFEAGNHEVVCLDANFLPDGTEYDSGNFDWEHASIPDEQLEWLQGVLNDSFLPVLVVCHQRIDKECSYAVKNHSAVHEILSASGKVKAVFQGHNHEEEVQQVGNIAYYTLQAYLDGVGPAVVDLDGAEIDLIRNLKG